MLLDALGRDPTLTGRTEVWRHYLATIETRTLTGFGTGVFSTPSALNVAVGGTVPGQERAALHSPHSLYLGILGETGVVGLAAFVLAGLYLAFVAPFGARLALARLSPAPSPSRSSSPASPRPATAMRPGVATVALLAARAAALRSGAGDPALAHAVAGVLVAPQAAVGGETAAELHRLHPPAEEPRLGLAPEQRIDRQPREEPGGLQHRAEPPVPAPPRP